MNYFIINNLCKSDNLDICIYNASNVVTPCNPTSKHVKSLANPSGEAQNSWDRNGC